MMLARDAGRERGRDRDLDRERSRDRELERDRDWDWDWDRAPYPPRDAPRDAARESGDNDAECEAVDVRGYLAWTSADARLRLWRSVGRLRCL